MSRFGGAWLGSTAGAHLRTWVYRVAHNTATSKTLRPQTNAPAIGRGFADLPTGNVIAIVVFGVALFIGVAWWNAHTARRLQVEIDTLDAS